jgi:prepilin-type processing-associated H-X9-DG protein
MVVEVAQDKAVEWTRPQDVTVRSDAPTEGLGRAHGAGTLVLFCDGSVRFLSSELPAEMIWAMFGASDGQVVQE